MVERRWLYVSITGTGCSENQWTFRREFAVFIGNDRPFHATGNRRKKDIAAAGRIRIAKGQNLYDDDYDFDEMNPEIAKMFGVAE